MWCAESALPQHACDTVELLRRSDAVSGSVEGPSDPLVQLPACTPCGIGINAQGAGSVGVHLLCIAHVNANLTSNLTWSIGPAFVHPLP